ncbi:Type I secretion system membrane fusion protein LapC [Paramagnetospirillum magnetotacticum MS-1]|uniref:Membrane fusion protein (MFP) family protein n=1 Tax=Paramagnetospirillum magnetotacticum MS-1 TaxID=272627 RepID=A0A0C2V6L1_PARME|nr:HlyD family type I secretion periplasmic adaptor subunit [Paramagnetospirillum magnetotacticum]KIM00687.1 Type I secretion system membrane fusion protein LapC [Paramagnetospirillum magnetotacticum MS-1]
MTQPPPSPPQALGQITPVKVPADQAIAGTPPPGAGAGPQNGPSGEQPQMTQEQMMQAMAAMMGGGGGPPGGPKGPPPTAMQSIRSGLVTFWKTLCWLMAAPEKPEDAPTGLLAWPRRILIGTRDWFLPAMNPIGPAPLQDYHAPQFGSRLYALANSYPLPTWRPLARVVMSLTGIFIVWAFVSHLDEVAIAEGEVVPEGKVKVIQHLEGGVVREIMVTDGSEVKEGAPLILLDLPVSSLNKEELQARMDGYMLQRARLEAELNDKPVAFPEEEAKRQPALVESERRSFEARRQALNATLTVLRDQVRQKGLEVQEYETKSRSITTSLRLSQERLVMSTDLIKAGLASKMDHVQIQSQVEDLKGQLESVRASIPRAEAAQQEAKGRVAEEMARFQRTAQSEMSEAELNIARTRELFIQATDQQRRTLIASPIDGIVKNMRSNTIGGVVRPGDPIMEIVPLHERLQVDAKLNPMDRGYVQEGQRATVKISAYDYTTYGGLDGDVILVAPDTTVPQTPNAQPYYRVVVQTDRAYIGDEQAKRLISAGMQATVEIHTGTRSIMEFLIKPVIKLRHEAFRER